MYVDEGCVLKLIVISILKYFLPSFTGVFLLPQLWFLVSENTESLVEYIVWIGSPSPLELQMRKYYTLACFQNKSSALTVTDSTSKMISSVSPPKSHTICRDSIILIFYSNLLCSMYILPKYVRSLICVCVCLLMFIIL